MPTGRGGKYKKSPDEKIPCFFSGESMVFEVFKTSVRGGKKRG